jgi:Reverse transcriptase (RNA-dependent DNA polymerase)
METKGVWEVVLMSSMPTGRKVVGNRWVLTENDDGNLRSNPVAQGFSRVSGKDFNDSHAPVKIVPPSTHHPCAHETT